MLTPQEVEELLIVLRRMTEDGKSIVLISHKLGEVLSVSDRITVLRDGQVIDTVTAASTSTSGVGADDGRPRSAARSGKGPAKPEDVLL